MANFQEIVYQKQYDLAIHYSSRIFAARVTIVGVIILAALYIMGISPAAEDKIPKIAEYLIPWFASILVGFLWIMELGYFLKFNQIVLVIRAIEEQESAQAPSFRSYFTKFQPFTHRFVYWFYMLSSVVFLALAFYQGFLTQACVWWILELLVLMLIWVYCAHQIKCIADYWREHYPRAGSLFFRIRSLQ